MVYLLPHNDSFAIFNDMSHIPEQERDKVIELESLPEGQGILKQTIDGSFYYEEQPFEPVEPEQPLDTVEPEQPFEPVETIDDKFARLELQLQEQQMQNLILVDINLTVYEELLNMKDQLSMLTGATDNA